MRFVVNREKLIKALGFVASAIPTRSTKPVLANVHIGAGDGVIRLTCTDLEVAIMEDLDADVSNAGATCVDPKRLQAGLTNMIADDVTLSLNADVLEVRGVAREKIKLPTMDSDEFPQPVAAKPEDALTFTVGSFRKYFRRGLAAGDKHEVNSKFATCSLCFEQKGDTVNVLTTDTRILSWTSIPGVPCATNTQSLIPLKTAQIVDRLLTQGKEDEQVSILCQSNQVDVWLGKRRINSMLMAGRFPPYRDIFPKKHEHVCHLPIAEFQRAAKIVRSALTEETCRMELQWKPGELCLSGKGAGEAEASIPTETTFEFEAAIDPEYLLTLLNGVEGMVTIELVDAEKPIVLRTADGWQGLIMPLAG